MVKVIRAKLCFSNNNNASNDANFGNLLKDNL